MLDYENGFQGSSRTIVMPRTTGASATTRIITRSPYEFGNPVPFDARLAEELRIFMVMTSTRKDPLINVQPPCHLSKEVRGEFKRFQCAWVAYYESPNPVLPTMELLNGITKGPEFIDWLKKVRLKSFIMSSGCRITDPSDLEEMPWYQIYDIGDIFNYRYWFFWDQEDPGDEKYYFEPIKPISSESLERFKDTLRKMIPDRIEKVPPEEILLQVSSSGCLKENTFTNSKHYKEVENGVNFSTKPLKAKSVYVQKCPGDTRTIVTLSPQQSNSVKWIERQLAALAEEISWSSYVRDPEEFENRFQTFKDKHSFFFCRDIKKDGLTKVRPLIQAVLQVVNEAYPYLGLTYVSQIYDDFTIEINGEIFHPPRGIGQGMSSAITTIIQSVLFNLTIDKLIELDNTVTGTFEAMFYHDDAVIGLTNGDDIDDFVYAEGLIFEEFQQIRNLRKSFEGPQFVFCERYSDELMDTKASMLFYLLRLPFAAINIAHAKALFQQISMYPCELKLDIYVEQLTRFWGYEFHVEEASKPYLLGGWIPAKYQGVDTTMWYYNPSKFDQAALFACKPFNLKMPKKKVNKIYRSPLEQIYGSNLDLHGQDNLYFYKVQTSSIERSMSRFLRPGTKLKAWSRVLRKRQKIWETRSNILLNMSEAYKEICKLHPKLDFLPTPEICLVENIENYPIVKDPINIRTPYLSFLKHWNPSIKVDKSVIPCPEPPGSRSYEYPRLSAQERRLAQDYSVVITGRYSGKLPFYGPSNFYYTKGYWKDPPAVQAAWAAFTHRFDLPDISNLIEENLELKTFRQMMAKIYLDDNYPLLKLFYEKAGWENLLLASEDSSLLVEALKTFKREKKIPEIKVEYVPEPKDELLGFRDYNKFLENPEQGFISEHIKEAFLGIYTQQNDLKNAYLGNFSQLYDVSADIEPLNEFEISICSLNGLDLDPERPGYLLISSGSSTPEGDEESLCEEFDPFDFG